MKNTLRLIIPLLLFTFPMVQGHADSNEFVFLLKGRGNVFWKVLRKGIEETAQANGITATILHTDDDQTPETQLNMCLTSIAKKPKFIVLGAATKNVGIECYKKAAAAGIQIADIDGNVSVQEAADAGVRLTFSVTSDNTLIGQSAAAYLAGNAKKQNPKILVIRGLPGSIVSERRALGFIDRLKETLPNAVIVGNPTADWDRMKALNTTLDVLQREPELSYIFSVSDVMTTGIVEAVKIAKKVGVVQIVSVDGIEDARKAIIAGKIAADVAQLPFLMGKRAVELSLKASSEVLAGYTEFTPTPLLTREVLIQGTSPELLYVR
jgi:D-allose transport system substrate-binding protein